MSDERRKFQRLNLIEPIEGRFDLAPVRILDVSATGALLLHEGIIPEGARGLLRFPWRGEEILVVSEVRRSDEGRSGLEFVADSEPLRAALAASVSELLRAQEANAEGDRAKNVISGDETITAAAGMRAVDVPVRPVYGPAWRSGISIATVVYPISFVLARSFVRRLVARGRRLLPSVERREPA